MADAERCLCCGAIIPEGRQVCPTCLVSAGKRRLELKPGTVFRGNINGALFEIVKIEGNIATIKEIKTGRTHVYGLMALKYCDITILDGDGNG